MGEGVTYGQWYRDAVAQLRAARLSNATNEAAWIFEETTGVPRSALHVHSTERFEESVYGEVCRRVQRRVAGEPLQYILGTQEFWGLSFVVTPAVLIPRPDTECLLRTALRVCPERQGECFVDVGTGSGCLAVALAVTRPQATVWATDRSVDALRVARRNARAHGVAGRIGFSAGDLLRHLSSARLVGKVAAVVANLPYIAEAKWDTLPSPVRDFEPSIALRGGPDGLLFYRRLVEEAAPILHPFGALVIELGEGQSETLRREWRCDPRYDIADIVQDSLGIDRVMYLRRTTCDAYDAAPRPAT